MADHPIIFSAPMIRALLAGTKTQTRRVLKRPPLYHELQGWFMPVKKGYTFAELLPVNSSNIDACTPYEVGERLWVREQFAYLPSSAYRMSTGIVQTIDPNDRYMAAVYREGFDRSGKQAWKPSIHMPRWASRLMLDITDVRVQRLQDISRDDAIAEGLEWVAPTYGISGLASSWSGDPRISYAALWDHINGFGAWDLNPWVAAYTFTVHRANIDQMEAAHG